MPEGTITLTHSPQIFITHVLNQKKKKKNSAQAKDMLSRGAVKVDGEGVDASFALTAGQNVVIQAGKKAFARVIVKK